LEKPSTYALETEVHGAQRNTTVLTTEGIATAPGKTSKPVDGIGLLVYIEDAGGLTFTACPSRVVAAQWGTTTGVFERVEKESQFPNIQSA
jgi:hypothetical protein